MKVNNTMSADAIVNPKGKEQAGQKEAIQQEQQAQIKNGNLKASELNLFQDPIEERKKKAMEEAMEFVKKQFESDGKVDAVLQECRDEIQSSKDAAKEASQQLVEIRKQKDELKEAYSDENNEDYKAQIKALDEEAGEWKKQYQEAHKVIAAATQGIKGIKQENLKHHGMVDATKAEEASLKASSDEIIGMLKDEAVDKIDKDLEEVVEEAKEEKEEKVREEAEQEKARLEREKQAQKVEENLKEQKQQAKKSYVPDTNLDVEDMMQKQQEVMRNTQEILEQQKLLEEEIKGIVVDSHM